MKLSSSEAWQVEPGELVRWRPVPGGCAARAIAPVSENERFHLDSVSQGQPGWIALTLDFPEKLDHDLLGEVAATVIARHDVLRSHYVRTEAGYQRLLHAGVDVKEEGREADAGLRADAFAAKLTADITATCNPFEPMPHYLAAVIRPASTTLVCGFDHCYVDARSLALLSNEICELLGGRGLAPAASGLDALCRVADREASVTADDPRLDGWAQFLASTGWTVPEFPLDLGVPEGADADMHTMVATLLSGDAAREFSSVVHDHGGRTYPAVLTCAAMAINLAGGPEEVATVVPTGTGAGPGCVGWSVGNAPMWISAADDLFTAMHRNTARLSAALPLAEIGLTPVYAAFGDRLRAGRSDVFMMSYVDYTRLPAPHSGVRAQQISSHKSTDTAQWWFWRDDDGIHVRVRHPHTERAVAVLTETLETMSRLVIEVTERVVGSGRR
ncbi:condensation protein [Gordonia sp. zg691]|uniref:Condensation protein n=1 Tax=Gordonia jinghuaiqii TaxID=2758710 RepID=A0A7D7R414_9ACTN|nr:condensation protein [Gordonia jinghuaiqii]MBD0861837.1 condensation protein [Gordonia jinghuaiqii]MCR5977729.1 condensation protein [Gordonia jinghuaiqii]QMT02392.1 condensation protein [Gordonia jinghuaiqii]